MNAPPKLRAEITYEKMGSRWLAEVINDFPILARTVHGRRLVYLDNAATTQKPLSVIETERQYYCEYNANIHRGVHELSERATEAYESAREKVRCFINAVSVEEIVFVRGTTEAINLIAQSWGRSTIRPGDEIVLSAMEHHSNIVPWQLLCQQTGAILKVVPINDAGEFLFHEYEKLFSERTCLVAVCHVSNALGSINPVHEIIQYAHDHGVPVLLDGAQSVAHARVDVQALDCDFYAFSGHKLYGPTGIGVLFGKQAILDRMPPWQGGGDMIRSVSFDKTEYNVLPYKFEAGTPNIAGAIGLGAAIDYLEAMGIAAIAAHETVLLDYATALLCDGPGLRLIGTAQAKAAIISFVMDGVHPHDMGTFLDHEGVAVRAGHHCAMPIMARFGIPGTVRASFGLYNTREDVDTLVAGIWKAHKFFN